MPKILAWSPLMGKNSPPAEQIPKHERRLPYLILTCVRPEAERVSCPPCAHFADGMYLEGGPPLLVDLDSDV